LKSGKPCARAVEEGAEVCGYHRSVEERREARKFLAVRLSPADQEELAEAAGREGVDAEIAMLRVLIRRLAGAGEIEACRRGMDTLFRMLKGRRELDRRARDRFNDSLARVLDALADEAEAEP
jgi:hypothetical protein